jgi:hypothetical protein
MTQRVEVPEIFGSYLGRDTTVLKLFVVLTSPYFENTMKVSWLGPQPLSSRIISKYRSSINLTFHAM